MRPENKVRYILSDREKKKILKEMGIRKVITLPFDETFRTLSPEEFLHTVLLSRLFAGYAAAGFNYRFGYRAAGDTDFLRSFCRQHGIVCDIVEPVSVGGAVVSASAIRAMIASGDLKTAAALMGRPYSIEERVVKGRQIGRTINSPTINQFVPENRMLPANGVYISRTKIGGRFYRSITNIGSRPTVGAEGNVNAETHIIGFDKDLYGKIIRVELFLKIRGEKKFSGLTELKNQIQRDVLTAVKYFEENHLQDQTLMIK